MIEKVRKGLISRLRNWLSKGGVDKESEVDNRSQGAVDDLGSVDN